MGPQVVALRGGAANGLGAARFTRRRAGHPLPGANLAREREQQQHFRLGSHNLVRQSGMHRQQLPRRECGRGPFLAGLQPEPAFEQVQGKDARLNVRIQRSPRAQGNKRDGQARGALPDVHR